MAYNCKKFCGRDADLICQTCLLKEISSRQILEELIKRDLVQILKTAGSGKIESYLIWESQLKKLENK